MIDYTKATGSRGLEGRGYAGLGQKGLELDPKLGQGKQPEAVAPQIPNVQAPVVPKIAPEIVNARAISNLELDQDRMLLQLQQVREDLDRLGLIISEKETEKVEPLKPVEERYGRRPQYSFEVTKSAVVGKVYVRGGSWIRNGVRLVVAGQLVSSMGGGGTIWAVLAGGSATSAFVYPTSVTLATTQSIESFQTSVGAGVDCRKIAIVTGDGTRVTGITQCQIGDIIDDVFYADYKSLNYNDTAGTAERYYGQLYEYHTLIATGAWIPACRPSGGVPSVLGWYSLDSEHTASYKSLGLTTLSGKGIIEAYGFQTGAAGTGAMGSNDRVYVRRGGATAITTYETVATLVQWFISGGDPGTPWTWESFQHLHHNHPDLNDGGDDADHAWAMCNDYSANYDSTHTRNYCESLATDEIYDYNDQGTPGSRRKRVDVYNLQLLTGSAGSEFDAVDWNSMLLTDQSDKLSHDWTSRLLKATNGTTTVLDYTAQGAAVADVAGATTMTATEGGWGFTSEAEADAFEATVAEIKGQLNALIARIRDRKLIAT